MSMPHIGVCPGNLSVVKNGTYSLAFRKEMFRGAKVSHLLDFPAPGKYISSPDDISYMTRLSISGVQIKFSLRLEGNKLVRTEKDGVYILKPVPAGVQQAEEVPANEHLTMQIARQVYGLETAVNGLIFYPDGSPAYITRRFDRKPDGTRYRQEDFTQLDGRTEDTHGLNYKYDFSYEEAALLMKKYIAAYMPELEKLFMLIVFNYLFSNGDAHLKNFSLLETTDRDFALSPAYDLLCSRIHSPNEIDLAPASGLFTDYETKSFRANGFYAYDDFFEFGLRIGLVPKRVSRFLEFFKTPQPNVDTLVQKSFLSEPVKALYISYYKDRLTRLNYSFAQR